MSFIKVLEGEIKINDSDFSENEGTTGVLIKFTDSGSAIV